MKGYIVNSGNYDLGDIGIVHVNTKTNARSVRVCWKAGRLHASAPKGIEADRLIAIIKDMLPKLEVIKPEPKYKLGQVIAGDEFTIEIKEQAQAPDKMHMSYDNNKGIIAVGSNWDMESNHTMVTISKMLCRIAKGIAPGILLPHAKEISANVGASPRMWSISTGHRVLGHCNARGEIALSYALVFYPRELREYVICHELAHLKEMNHSARFHAICDAYCNGREKDLILKLKTFRSPLI